MIRRLRSKGARRHEAVFRRIYESREWGACESASGPGSGLTRTAALRRELPRLLAELGVESVLDAGCGDFHWLSEAALPVRFYVGVEVVPELAAELARLHAGRGRTFVAADITRDRLQRTDLVLCRDVLVHFPDDDVELALANVRRSEARWLLTTTFVARPANEPIALGGWRPLNLEAPPFDLPTPIRVLEDIPVVDRELYLDKRLALWDLAK